MGFLSNGAVFGKDLDDVFAYSTDQKVKIRDRRLCCARILIMLAIFFYIVIWSIFKNKEYLQREPPTGFARIGLQSNHQQTDPLPNYCGPQESTASGLQYAKLPCINWDSYEALYPEDEELGFLLSTRIIYSAIDAPNTPGQTGDCFLSLGNCSSSKPFGVEATYFVPFVEEYSILLSHVVYGRNTNVQHRELNMKEGKLLDKEGDTLIDFKKRREETKSRVPGDVVTMSQIFQAADVSLDRESQSTAGETWRYSGVVLLCIIDYFHPTFSWSHIGYKMRFVAIEGLEDKLEQVLWRDINGDTLRRVIINRHGIRLIVIQTGAIGTFSFTKLLLTLIAGAALVSVADFIVQHIVLKMLPLKRIYKNYQYLTTVDFSEAHLLDKANNELQVETHGDRYNYQFRAHDYRYGTLLRGGSKHTTEWPMGQGPELAYATAMEANNVITDNPPLDSHAPMDPYEHIGPMDAQQQQPPLNENVAYSQSAAQPSAIECRQRYVGSPVPSQVDYPSSRSDSQASTIHQPKYIYHPPPPQPPQTITPTPCLVVPVYSSSDQSPTLGLRPTSPPYAPPPSPTVYTIPEYTTNPSVPPYIHQTTNPRLQHRPTTQHPYAWGDSPTYTVYPFHSSN